MKRLIEAHAHLILPRAKARAISEGRIEGRFFVADDGCRIPIISGGATGTAMTNYLEDALLNEVLRATNYVAPATIYSGLFTAAPGEAGGGTEVSGNAYARQSMAFGAPAGGICGNSADVLYPVATPATWGSITDFALFDAVTAGNMVIYGALTAAKTINAGDQFVFRAGQLTVQFD
jgi:hypothetical protein